MSTQIPQAFVEQYRDNVYMLAQQKGSRLRNTVRNDGTIVGRSVYYDRIGPTAAVKVTTRHADTPLVNTPHSRRKGSLVDYDWADLVDWPDKLRTIYDPTNPYAVNAMWAMGRALDDEIITAFNADAEEGQSGGTTVSFPSSQVVAAGGSGLTLSKLLSAKEILDAAEVDPDVPRYAVVSAKQITDLLNTTEVKSSDYNTVKALAQGEVNTYLGFEFVRSERLPKSGSTRSTFFYTGMAIGLGISKEIQVDIGPRRDKRNSVQVYVCMSCGATRIEDEQVVQVDCVES